MAAIQNPERYHIIAFNANFALSGGIVFAKDGENKYYFVSDFRRSDINSRRYPYCGVIEDIEYLFTADGYTATKVYQLFCVDGIVDDGGGSTSTGTSTSGSGEGVPGELTYREKIALQALNGMIQLTPNPMGYKDSTIRLLTQKAFEFADEFIGQAEHIREDTGETGGEGDELDKATFEEFTHTFRDAMFTEGQGSNPTYDSILAAVKGYMHDALFVTVGSGSGETEVSVFEVMKDQIIATVREVFTTDVSVGSTPNIKNMADLLKAQSDIIQTISDDIDDIRMSQEDIADALTGSGSGGGGGLMGQLAAINLGVQQTNYTLGTKSSSDPTILTRLGDTYTLVSDTNTKVTNLDFTTLENKIDTIDGKIGAVNTTGTLMAYAYSAMNYGDTINTKLGTINTANTLMAYAYTTMTYADAVAIRLGTMTGNRTVFQWLYDIYNKIP